MESARVAFSRFGPTLAEQLAEDFIKDTFCVESFTGEPPPGPPVSAASHSWMDTDGPPPGPSVSAVSQSLISKPTTCPRGGPRAPSGKDMEKFMATDLLHNGIFTEEMSSLWGTVAGRAWAGLLKLGLGDPRKLACVRCHWSRVVTRTKLMN